MLNARDLDTVAPNNAIIHPMYGLPHAKRVEPVSPPGILCGVYLPHEFDWVLSGVYRRIK